MTSTFDELYAESASQILAHFGRSVTRYALGASASSSTVTAIWWEHKPKQETEYGLTSVREGTLKIDIGETVNLKDRFIIDGNEWGVTTIGESGGFHILSMVFITAEYTKKSSHLI